MLMDIGIQTNKRTIRKGVLFRLLLMNILNIIDMWPVGLEYCENLNAVVSKIKIPCNLIEYMIVYGTRVMYD